MMSGSSSSTPRSGSSFSCAMRRGTLRMVKRWMSRPCVTSCQRSGVDTVAPGTGRTLNGAASSLPEPFWR